MATLAELKSQGIKWFGEVGAWACDEWKILNDTFFDGKNKPGAIIWGSTLQGDSLGYYHLSENLIYLHKNLMRPIYPTTDFKWGIRGKPVITTKGLLKKSIELPESLEWILRPGL